MRPGGRRFVRPLLPAVVGVAIAGAVFGARAPRSDEALDELLQRYANVVRLIETRYPAEVTPETIAPASVTGILRRLDPHSNLVPPRRYVQMRERQQGEYEGLGIRVTEQNGELTVVSPFEGTPAYRLGIRAGDVISGIEGEDATGYTMDESVRLLRGPAGTSVRITIRRPRYDAPLEFTVMRAKIPLLSVPYAFLLDEETGYVRVSDFIETTEQELLDAIVDLRLEGATRLILDLRHNPGGLLNGAVSVANVFLEQGTEVVSIRGRDSRQDQVFFADEASGHADLPLVILVSRESASASEIVAGAVQDHDRGLVVGETTYGKGLVQSVYRISGGYALALTTAEYFTPSGRSLQRAYELGEHFDYYRAAGQNAEAGEVHTTAQGRTIYGGGGVAPDIVVSPPETPDALLALERRAAFFEFATRFAPADGRGLLDGAGVRPDETAARSEQIRAIDQEFRADESTIEEFVAFLAAEGFDHDAEAIREHGDQVAYRIDNEVLALLWGSGAARRATIDRDPQVRAARAALADAALLLRDPKAYLAAVAGS